MKHIVQQPDDGEAKAQINEIYNQVGLTDRVL